MTENETEEKKTCRLKQSNTLYSGANILYNERILKNEVARPTDIKYLQIIEAKYSKSLLLTTSENDKSEMSLQLAWASLITCTT